MADVRLAIDCEVPLATDWGRLLSERGLCAAGELRSKEAGDDYHIETAAGDLFAGRIARWIPDRELELVIDNMHRSELTITTAEALDRDPARVELKLVAFGLHHDEIESFRWRWKFLLQDLLGGQVEIDV